MNLTFTKDLTDVSDRTGCQKIHKHSQSFDDSSFSSLIANFSDTKSTGGVSDDAMSRTKGRNGSSTYRGVSDDAGFESKETPVSGGIISFLTLIQPMTLGTWNNRITRGDESASKSNPQMKNESTDIETCNPKPTGMETEESSIPAKGIPRGESEENSPMFDSRDISPDQLKPSEINLSEPERKGSKETVKKHPSKDGSVKTKAGLKKEPIDLPDKLHLMHKNSFHFKKSSVHREWITDDSPRKKDSFEDSVMNAKENSKKNSSSTVHQEGNGKQETFKISNFRGEQHINSSMVKDHPYVHYRHEERLSSDIAPANTVVETDLPESANLEKRLLAFGKLNLMKNGREAKLTLYPPELGKVKIKLFADKGHTTARFLVENEDARRLLLSGEDFLRNSMIKHNLEMDNFEVIVSDYGPDGEHDRYEGKGTSEHPGSPVEKQHIAEIDTSFTSSDNPSGLISLYA